MQPDWLLALIRKKCHHLENLGIGAEIDWLNLGADYLLYTGFEPNSGGAPWLKKQPIKNCAWRPGSGR